MKEDTMNWLAKKIAEILWNSQSFRDAYLETMLENHHDLKERRK